MDLLLRTGDAIHLAAILILLGAILKKRSAVGVSAATQTLFLITFVARYVDLFHDPLTSSYRPILKVAFTGLTLATLVAVCVGFRATYDRQNERCTTIARMNAALDMLAILTLSIAIAGGVSFASLVGTHEFSSAYTSVLIENFLWIFSKNLEVFALIPQFGMIYRNRKVEPTVAAYVLLLGIYRVLYVVGDWDGLLTGSFDDYSARAGLVQCFLIFCLGVPLMLWTKASSSGTNNLSFFRPSVPSKYAKKLSSVYHIKCADAASTKGHSDERKPLIIP